MVGGDRRPSRPSRCLTQIALLVITACAACDFTVAFQHSKPCPLTVPSATQRVGESIAVGPLPSARTIRESHCLVARSRLFSSSQAAGDDGSSKNNPKKGRGNFLRRLNPIPRIKKLVVSAVACQAVFRERFAGLPKKAKLVVCAQLMILGLVTGSVGRKMYVAASGNTAVTRPVEVPYSMFMDLTESSGKGHVPGTNPAITIDGVVIGKDRVGFRVAQDEERHAKALRDKRLVDGGDVSIQSVESRRVYAMKPNASPDLVDFLRGNKIPFRAASTKGTNAAAAVARSAIFLLYLLFLLRMYRSMNGGGGGADTPGKLALSLSDETIVRFEDIAGIDKAKFEVMEFVDTLRHPQKYAMLGARAPTGLLLEGPPGTGKTMLARATAASAGVPLLYCSGSDFVEMFVGRGAARVRKTFARAAKMSPCIIFIDEVSNRSILILFRLFSMPLITLIVFFP